MYSLFCMPPQLVFSFGLLGNRFTYTLRTSWILIYTSLISTSSKLDERLTKTVQSSSFLYPNQRRLTYPLPPMLNRTQAKTCNMLICPTLNKLLVFIVETHLPNSSESRMLTNLRRRRTCRPSMPILGIIFSSPTRCCHRGQRFWHRHRGSPRLGGEISITFFSTF